MDSKTILQRAGHGLSFILLVTFTKIPSYCRRHGCSNDDLMEVQTLTGINDAIALGSSILYGLAVTLSKNKNVLTELLKEYEVIRESFDMNAVTLIQGPLVSYMNKNSTSFYNLLKQYIDDDETKVETYIDLANLMLGLDLNNIIYKVYRQWLDKDIASVLESILDKEKLIKQLFYYYNNDSVGVYMNDIARGAVHNIISLCTMNLIKYINDNIDDYCRLKFVSIKRGAFLLKEFGYAYRDPHIVLI